MGVKNTFSEKFVEKSVLEKYGYLTKAKAMNDSSSGMIFFFGFNTTNDELGLPTANIWYEKFDDDKDIFALKKVFSTCLACRDPDYPSGLSDFFILSMGVDFDLFKPWVDTKTQHRPPDYYTFKKKFEDAAVNWLIQTFPSVEPYLDVVVTSSPLTIRDYLNHDRGSVYGIQVTPENGWITMKTDIKGLILAGQDLLGPEVQGNMANGILAGQIVLDEG